MADKYLMVQSNSKWILECDGHNIATISCTPEIAELIDNALNHQSRAGSKSTQAKREAARANIAKRWAKTKA